MLVAKQQAAYSLLSWEISPYVIVLFQRPHTHTHTCQSVFLNTLAQASVLLLLIPLTLPVQCVHRPEVITLAEP